MVLIKLTSVKCYYQIRIFKFVEKQKVNSMEEEEMIYTTNELIFKIIIPSNQKCLGDYTDEIIRL